MLNSKNIYDVVIIGAGFAGLYSLFKAKSYNLNAIAIERGSDVGGTWYWNRYPGARCDVESMQYSYQFSRELQEDWEWTEKYATQPEILEYASHVADRFKLRKNILFNTEIKAAKFIEDKNIWELKDHENKLIKTKFCIMATGCLSTLNKPNFKNLKSFNGDILHTGNWPKHNVNLSNKVVGIIGTGSSAIQCIPEIIKKVKHLYVFQRTPHYTVPARNASLKYLKGKNKKHMREPIGYDNDLYVEEIKYNYSKFRLKAQNSVAAMALPLNKQSALDVSENIREAIYEERWNDGGVPFIAAFEDLNFNRKANETAAKFVRKKIKSLVKNTNTAKLLTPNYPIGCKRLAVDSNYYETYNKPNISLIDIKKDAIKEFNKDGISTKNNNFKVDVIILATGFDAMTGTLFNIDIQGINSIKLKNKWSEGPKNFLGIASAGFPNLFTISGPGSPSVLTNMIVSIEQHVNWVFDCINYMKINNKSFIEPTQEAEEYWYKHNQEVSIDHVRSSCSSWYIGGNIEGKAKNFMPYVGGYAKYVEKCNKVSKNNYVGFKLK
ncbi:MAG: Phenylacetone monooxygenase [Alphaproteobacteria bacterium MarineAlpha9_Bin3]|nr:MAG: Phenylacetone monooxygenase [Alphaproteobacteria bacterium MarineAlpha9_Bin3]|tara:strand:+ start:8804 stop:10456 length:1653 start_codon:yes stop_codon:yes gene_type:complete